MTGSMLKIASSQNHSITKENCLGNAVYEITSTF